MPINQWLTLSKSSRISAMLMAIMINGIQANEALALTGDDILTKLDTDAQVQHIGGVLAGLGYARFLKDRPNEAGLKCIEGWLEIDTVSRWKVAKQWLKHHKEKPVAVIVYAMVSKDCGV